MTIFIHSDWSSIDAELDRLEAMPTEPTKALLNGVLTAAFLATQAEVHVITESLKGSGNAYSEDEDGEWTGTVAYGGPSPGRLHDPVRYAAYEQARGGDHDFMHPLLAFHDRFTEAMRDGLEI